MIAVLLDQILIMFVLIAVGYVLVKSRLLIKDSTKDISTLLVYCAMPCVILNAYNIPFTVERLKGLGVVILLALLVHVIAFAIAHFFFHKEDGIIEFSAAFSNAGFVGIPLVQAALGEEAVFYVSTFVACVLTMQFTYGSFIIAKSTRVIRLSSIIRIPVVVATVIGLVLFVLHIPYPNFLGKSIAFIAALNTPLAMFNIGVLMGEIPLLSLFKGKRVYKTTLVRLFVIPFALIAVFKLLPSSMDMIKMALLIAAATPAPANVTIIAQTYQRDVVESVKIVSLSTILSALSIPLVVFLAEFLW